MPRFDEEGDAFLFDNVVDSDSPVVSRSDHYLRLPVNHFSPFVIIWDELPPLPADLPQTGDSAPLAPWLLLLSGACALLLSRKRAAA